jgi:uncharacterized protein (TIGR04222 family)
MNPFDYYGPQFLVFYAGLTVVTLIVMSFVRRGIDRSGDVHDDRLTDAYLIALLRSGNKEMVRVTIVSLLDRGLLEITDQGVRTTEIGSKTRARRNIEHLILQHCREPRLLSTLADHKEFAHECKSHEAELQRMGLLPTGEQRASRLMLFLVGGGFLAAVSITKIAIALSRGRSNILFLILATAFAVYLTAGISFPRTTTRGDSKLRELTNLFQSLKLRAADLKPGGSTSELAMMTAVYGATSLPQDNYPWLAILYPRPKPSDSSGSSSGGCGSSCGSSCGGGCGGGCGGCGS